VMDLEKDIVEALAGVKVCPCCGTPMKGGI